VSLDPLPDLWATRDHPVLVAAARLLEERRPPITSNDIAAAAGLEHQDSVRALLHLGDEHLKIRDSSTYDGLDCYVYGITPEGLRAAGQWPSPEAAAERFLAALDELIKNTDEGSPKGAWLRTLRQHVTSFGLDVLGRVGKPDSGGLGEAGRMAVRQEISDESWAVLEPLFPVWKGNGRPILDMRRTLEGIAWRFRTGAPWRDIPERFGNWNSIYGRFSDWSKDGTWSRVLATVQGASHRTGDLDWTVSVDSTITRVHQHGASLPRDTGGLVELQESGHPGAR